MILSSFKGGEFETFKKQYAGGLRERVVPNGGGGYNIYPANGGLPVRGVPNGGGQPGLRVPIIAP